MSTHFDVIIVGAGISGVCAAYHLQKSLPTKSFTILESRSSIGGTWDLFRYPGVRSDSDMYTLGFPWRPWQKAKLIAEGEAIRQYVEDSAREYDIDQKIVFGVRVKKLTWSSQRNSWLLDCETHEGVVRYSCGFVFMCAGYYSYERGYTPAFDGVSDFTGRIVHPQAWRDDIDYSGKRVIVIGSGATAMTLVPALAEKAAHVTTLQRSPSYVFAAPSRDPVSRALRARLPAAAAYRAARWLSIAANLGFYKLSKARPELASRFLLTRVREALSASCDVEQHFTPRYKVWDQRVCLIPDADLFRALRAGRASVVTEHIDRFTPFGLKLKNGEELAADLIVTATGIELQMLGGVEVEVDGQALEITKALIYKGCMLSDVPNLAMFFGYINASWTLKADLTASWLCRLLAYMDRHAVQRCVPRKVDRTITSHPMLDLTSGYVARAVGRLPSQGSKRPYKFYQNYLIDFLTTRLGSIDDGSLELSEGGGAIRPPR